LRDAGLAWRLTIVVGLVLVAGAATLWVVAVLVAPQVFHRHLLMAVPGGVDPAVQVHVDAAFTSAVLLALGVALPLSLLTGLTVTWLVARRLAGSVSAVAAAAETIAHGDLGVRVQEPAMGPELERLVAAFNAMADRLAATEETRRRLIGDVAHELRTPLAALEATVDAVVDGVLPADVATLTELREQASRLDRLVTDMSAVSRAEERALAVDLAPTDLGAVAGSVVEAHRARFAAAGVRLGLEPDPGGAPVVAADRARLEEVLHNLLDNGLRHTPRGGAVQVLLGHDRDTVSLAVVDDGEGFGPAEAERLFERFYRGDTARSTGGGSGIGLTIARAVVGAHGGTLTAASAGPGTGAAFTVRLPRADTDEPSPAHRTHRRG
jgi:signal transduction histidine kinase